MAYSGSGAIIPLILYLSTRWRWMVSLYRGIFTIKKNLYFICYYTMFSNTWMKIIKCTSVQDPWHAYAVVTDKSHLSDSAIVAFEDSWIS